MKKLLLIFCFVALAMITSAQSIFKPVPEDLFANKASLTASQSAWLWRLSVDVSAIEYTYDKETKSFDSYPLSSAGPAIGFRHYTQLPDGSPYNDYGINLAILLGTDITKISPAQIKAALLFNAFEFVNVGVSYNFVNRSPGILLGGSINF